MKLSLVSIALLFGLVGCTPVALSVAPARAGVAASPTRAEEAVAAERASTQVMVQPDPRHELIVVRVTVDRPIHDWMLPDRPLHQLTVTDARGVVAPTLEGRRLHLDVARATLPLTLSYSLQASASSSPSSSAACPFALDPDRAHFCGAAVLPMPADEAIAQERTSVLLELQRDRELHRDAATSLGPIEPSGAAMGRQTATLSFEQLAHTAFVFGALGQARFSATEGRDHGTWLGYFGFDPRWVCAEAAGVRTMVDQWLGVTRPADDPSVAMVLLQGGAGREVEVQPLHHGLLIVSQVSATWTARARLEVTRRFVQRTLGSVRIDARDGEDSLWFDEGVAHAAALSILQGAGILTRGEVAAEVSSLLAEEALSPVSGMGLVELGRATKDPDKGAAARRLLAVRGALLALASDAAPSLQGALRSIVDLARQSGGHITQEEVLARLSPPSSARKPGSSAADALSNGQEIPLQEGDIDRCIRIENRQLVAYEPGFELRTEADGSRTIQHVSVDSAAARAGLRPGQLVVSLDEGARRADAPVRIEVRQETGTKMLEYLPRGTPRRGRAALTLGGPRCAEP